MAQLKSLLVSGPTRLIGDSFANKIELTSISAPKTSGGTEYSLGTNGQILKSNGSSVYWTSLGGAAGYGVTDSTSASAIGTSTSLPTERDIYYGLPFINNAHNYTSNTTIYAPTAGGTAGYVLVGAGTTTAPTWSQTLAVANGGTGATTAAGAWTALGGGASGKHDDSYFALASHGTHVTYGTSATAIGTASAGSATTVSRSDHVHNISLATGDNNGQVKIAGTNVSVKGLGSAAYTDSTAYAAAGHNHDSIYLKLTGGTLTGDTYHNSNTGSKKFYFTRNGTTSESTAVWVDDTYTYFDVINDEATANVKFTLHATDTEANSGAGDQTSYVTFIGANGQSTITANKFSGALAGNADTATKLKNGRTFQIKDADNTNAGTASSAFDGQNNLIINLPSTIKATLSGNAATATALTSNAGSSSLPIYFTSGKPSAISNISLVATNTDSKSVNVGNSNGQVELLASTNRGVYDTTNSKWIVYTAQAADHTYIPLWSSKGSSTQPVYFNSSGEPVACTSYANASVNYATSAGSATNANYVNLYEARGTTTTLNKSANYVGAGKMFHLVASSSTSSTDNGKPPMGDANILQMNWDNNGGYDAQLGISTGHTDASPARMEFRSQISNKTAWREVVTSTPGTAAGGTTQPIYISASGVATATTYALNKTVPSDAVFTDTKNTAGSTDTTSKIFLIGATSQAASAQTYSDSEVYVTNGTLYAVKSTDAEGTSNNKPALIVGGADTAAHLEFDANEIMAKSNGTTVGPLYLNQNGGLVYANQKKVVRLTSDPTSGQVMIADGTDGQIKSSGYTLAQSVTSSSKLTDENVKQTAITDHSTSAEYRIILSGSTNDTTETKGVNKDTNLKFNTGTQLLSIGGSISATGNLTITGNTNLNNETYADSLTAGSLLVTGNSNFTQIPTAPTPANSSNDTSIATTEFVKNSISSLSNAMHFIGKATVAITDGSTTDPAISGYSTKVAGDVVIDKDTSYEYVWTKDGKWERLGPDSSYSLSTHTHGNISNDGKITSTATIANGDKLVIIDVDSTAGSKLTGSSITFDGSTETNCLTQKGTWKPFNNYTHPTGDGNLHVPATGTSNNGKFLKAGSTAGSLSWGTAVTSITPGNGLLNGTGTTAITTSGTLNINYGTSAASAVSTTAAAGSANTVSRSDHVHSISVVNNNINLLRNTETIIATIAGTAIKIKLPASDNTDTKVNVVKRGTTKSYILGDTTAPPDSAAAHTAVAESYIYMTSTAGQMSAKSYSFNDGASTPTEKAQMIYNTTTGCLEIIVA